MRSYRPEERVLFKFPHGLGDVVQFTIVLQHLKEHYPDTIFDVQTNRGKASLLPDDLVCQAFDSLDQVDLSVYDHVYLPPFWECAKTYSDLPSTKTYLCLREDFGIEPRSLPYRVRITDHDQELVSDYLKRIPDGPFVLIHYEGNSAVSRKNLRHETIRSILPKIIAAKRTPVILDWDNRSPLVDQKTVLCPTAQDPLWEGKQTGEASTIAALISKAELMIGIDSGPEHLCAATNTPLIVCWTRHHPLHFFDLSGDVLHLIPKRHARLIRGDRSIGNEFFRSNYSFSESENFASKLSEEIEKRLPAKPIELPNCSCSQSGFCPIFQRHVSAREQQACCKGDDRSVRLKMTWSREIGLH